MSHPWSAAQFEDYLHRPRIFFFVAKEIKQITGFVLLQSIVPEAELFRLVVAPQFRRQGVGLLLLQSSLRHLHTMGVQTCFLEVRDSNKAAQSLYERVGFRETGRRKKYYRVPVEDALLLQNDCLENL